MNEQWRLVFRLRIGWLHMLLDELASETAVERWLSEDERGLLPGGIGGAKAGSG